MLFSTQEFFIFTQELIPFSQEILPLLPTKLRTPYSRNLRVPTHYLQIFSGYFSTQSPPLLRHISYRCTNVCMPVSLESTAIVLSHDVTACWGTWSENSEIVKSRFCETVWGSLSISSCVTRDGRPLRSSSSTLVLTSVNCPHHRQTILSLIMWNPYTWHNWRWISAGDSFWEWGNLITARILQLAGDNISAAIFS